MKFAVLLLSIHLLYVTKCYSTISMDSLHVLARVLPLDSRSGMDRDLTVLVRWHEYIDGSGFTPETVNLWPTPKCKDLRQTE